MSWKKYIPSMNESIKIVVVVTILAITGIGAKVITQSNKMLNR